jgi:hypothetical protein
MTVESTRLSVAGLAIAFLTLAAPARAQNVTFTDVRDAVPAKFFNPSADSTRAHAADPNTLQIGFESGRDSGDFLDNEFRASTEAFGNRVAMDTLSFNVVAPPGYYVSSITYVQAGAGSIVRVADARGASSWIVAGEPAHLGFFRANPALSRTVTLSDSQLTVVPVSITTNLSVFAAATSGDATVELTSAKVVVTVAPLAPGDVKKSALIVVSGYTGTYDGAAHGATGTATGVNGEPLTGLLSFGESFTDAPGGTANWTFAGNATYNPAEGTAAITINRADAVIAVAGFTGTYDGAAHGATGTATGVNGESLNAFLDLGASFTAVGVGTASWSFGGGTNYNAAAGSVAITITRATPILAWPQPASITAGTALTAAQLNATANVNGTFVYDPPLGTVLTETRQLSAAFTPADTANYDGATVTVTITVTANTGVQIVNPGSQTDRVGDEVRLRLRLADSSSRPGSGKDRRGTFTAAGLPPGLFIEREDGEIRGRLTTAGQYRVTVTFTRDGVTVSTQFDWTVVSRSNGGKD